jgi:hypothetical protein
MEISPQLRKAYPAKPSERMSVRVGCASPPIVEDVHRAVEDDAPEAGGIDRRKRRDGIPATWKTIPGPRVTVARTDSSKGVTPATVSCFPIAIAPSTG